jgi:predicted metal-dependent hydrolase
MDPTALPQIIRRRVNIAFDPAKARGWYFSKKEIEDFLNAVSFIFPPGEKFFIQSVQNYRDRITDPVLKEQVKRFIYQEAMHTKEHVRCNLALTAVIPDGHKIEEFTAKFITAVHRFSSKATQLAWTCALEHFTAILADTLLRNQEAFLSETDPAFASLWLWHAVEESEHKAVCFDVYQETAGKGVLGYLHRVTVMFLASLTFLITLYVAVRQVRKSEKAGKQNPVTESPTAEKRLTDESRDQPSPNPSGKTGLRRFLEILPLKLYFDYYRPSFHPWDHNNIPLIDEWKERYRDFGGPDVAVNE